MKNKHLRVKKIEQQIQTETKRYVVAIKDENYIDAKATMHAIAGLHTEMDNLLPYIAKENALQPAAKDAETDAEDFNNANNQ